MSSKSSLNTRRPQEPPATLVSMEQHYSGPLPPAVEMKAYGEVMKDAPERIMAMAEQEQAQRHRRENFSMRVRFIDNFLGMLFGMGVVGLCLFMAYDLGLKGHDWLAGAIVTIATTLGAIFVLRKEPKK